MPLLTRAVPYRALGVIHILKASCHTPRPCKARPPGTSAIAAAPPQPDRHCRPPNAADSCSQQRPTARRETTATYRMPPWPPPQECRAAYCCCTSFSSHNADAPSLTLHAADTHPPSSPCPRAAHAERGNRPAEPPPSNSVQQTPTPPHYAGSMLTACLPRPRRLQSRCQSRLLSGDLRFAHTAALWVFLAL